MPLHPWLWWWAVWAECWLDPHRVHPLERDPRGENVIRFPRR